MATPLESWPKGTVVQPEHQFIHSTHKHVMSLSQVICSGNAEKFRIRNKVLLVETKAGVVKTVG